MNWCKIIESSDSGNKIVAEVLLSICANLDIVISTWITDKSGIDIYYQESLSTDVPDLSKEFVKGFTKLNATNFIDRAIQIREIKL